MNESGVMIDQSKKIFIGCIVILSVVIHLAARSSENDAISQLLASTTDSNIKDNLQAFLKTDIQKEINDKDYDIEAVISYAESIIGTPHRMGGTTLKGLDCSGLVMLSHAKQGVFLPHGSQDQARYGRILAPDEELARGDLLFFHSTYRTSKLVTHAAIYIGEGKFIHVSTSRGVSISEVNDGGYWERHYLFATRLRD